MPSEKTAPEHKDRVMHALLRLGDTALMMSDTMPGQNVSAGGNVHVSLNLQDTFWGARFGMITDAYGIQWMFNCETKKS